ncbi:MULTISPECIES: ABC transporter substrate-binding protein [Actinokineospora]|uniref:Sugar ABC transporter substrate-binding protein n=1 Tax=Actinokineospora fastidiosa TaxID=1816 RepID=A0A918L6T3_9PSEU|nr:MULTISPECIES: ABC transporter substrate-binding protein [Actinokineospora]UVS77148.1 Trehalose-binding lipoprotein LpqY precursor [Actinokineospora sp. UTMC 2448]GGS13155.1 sugar ABC transporter substrate-binding protein [Actinokineospora fastidiosa]
MKHPPGRRRLPAVLCAAVLATSAACGSDGGPLTINVYYSTEQNFDQVVARCTDEADGRYVIALNTLPRTADAQREQMVRRLAAGDTDMDVLGLDVTWVAEFAEAGWIQEWTGADRADVEAGTLEGPLQTAMWEGKLYSAPKNTNVQLLWYRSDLTPEPPRSWSEMLQMAERLRDQGKPHTVLMTGAQYEGLVVQFNTLVEGAGGRILSEDSTRAVFDEGAVEALEALRNLAVSPVSSPSLSNAQEDDIRLAFQDGGAAFQINWPYVYAAMTEANPELIETLRWAPYPALDPANTGTATLGGFNLAVSAYSEHKAEAFEAAKCLRSAESQKFSAINSGVPPTIESVYAEPEMEEAYPMRETILAELKKAAIRPLTPAYQNVSTLISTILSPPRDINPPETADRLRREVQNALDSKGVLP